MIGRTQLFPNVGIDCIKRAFRIRKCKFSKKMLNKNGLRSSDGNLLSEIWFAHGTLTPPFMCVWGAAICLIDQLLVGAEWTLFLQFK